MENRPNGQGGLNTLTLLGVLFVGLKLTGHISWPWIWVLAPFWVPFAILFWILVVFFLIWIVFGIKGPQ
jgi:hypothetical protein